MSSSKKPRNKKYRPKSLRGGLKFLNNLPMPGEKAAAIVRESKLRLTSMRISPKRPADITSVALFFGVCWLLAEKMTEVKAMQELLSRAILLLTREWKVEGPLTPEAYTAAMDALEFAPKILEIVTAQEYIDATALIRDSDTLAHIDGHLDMTAAKLDAEGLCVDKAPETGL